MTAGSTLAEVKQSLVARLKARPGLAGVQVSYAYPDDFAEGRDGEDIWLAGAEGECQPMGQRGGGALPTLEDFRLVVVLQSLKHGGQGQQAADAAATVMLAELQAELATAPQLGGVLMVELAGWRHVPGPFAASPGGHGSRYECQVRVRARLG